MRLCRTATIPAFAMILGSACAPFFNALPTAVCEPSQVDTSLSALVLQVPEQGRAGEAVTGRLSLSNSYGKPCRVDDPSARIRVMSSDASALLASSPDPKLRLGQTLTRSEELRVVSWDEEAGSYLVEVLPTHAGQRALSASLEGRELAVLKSESEKLETVEIMPGNVARLEFRVAGASVDGPIAVTDNGSVRVTAKELDAFNNEIGDAAISATNSGAWYTNLEADSSDPKALTLRPRGVAGSFDVQVTASSGSLQAAGTIRLESSSYISTLSNLRAWFRADSLTLADGAPVASWPDSSSPSNEPLTNATPGERPVFRAAGLGGRPSVQYSGGQLLARSALDFGDSGLTLVAVYSASGRGGSGGGARILNNGHSGWNSGYFLGASPTMIDAGIGGPGQSTSTLINNTAATLTNAYDGVARIVVYHYDRTQKVMTLHVNGVQIPITKTSGTIGTLSSDSKSLDVTAATQLSTNNAFPSRGFRIGGEVNWYDLLVGHVAEAAVFSRGLSSDELTGLTRSLGRKYGIAVP
jgi:hypothetical protein